MFGKQDKQQPVKPKSTLLDGTIDTPTAARYIGVTPYLIRQLDKRGILKPRFRHGRNRRYFQEDLDAWIQKQREKKDGDPSS